MSLNIAILGATGYVGMHVVDELLRAGHRVSALMRPTSAILLGTRDVRAISAADLRSPAAFDLLVNLAYPTSGSNLTFRRQNEALVEQMSVLGQRAKRVVHISTLAVFGYSLSRRIHTGPVSERFDDPYIESKLRMEHLLQKHALAKKLDIVRLGNVWGPASPTWTAALSDRLLFGEPCAVRNQDGFSNVTDVANVASYIAHLAKAPREESEVVFHHLAEFSRVRWSHWTSQLATALGVEIVSSGAPGAIDPSFRRDLRHAFASSAPVAVLRALYAGDKSGAAMRRALAYLPERLQSRMKRLRAGVQQEPSAAADAILLSVLSCSREFQTNCDATWTPPLSSEESWARVVQWMREVGYLPRETHVAGT